MVRQFALKHPPLSVLRERENIFKLLGSSSNDSLQKNYAAYTIDPRTRYSGFDTKRVSNMTSLKGLYDTDDLESADMTLTSPSSSPMATSAKKVASRKRSTSGKRFGYKKCLNVDMIFSIFWMLLKNCQFCNHQ